MPYEYSFIVNTLTIKPGMADQTSNEVSQELGKALLSFALPLKQAANIPPGGWDVISHDVTRIDRHLVVTFLLRRKIP